MSNFTLGSYEQHKNCTTGQTVISSLDNGQKITGTVMKSVGATVYVASDDGKMYEMRRVKDSSTGEKAIVCGFDGKEVDTHQTKEGVNPEGMPITSESATLSFDHRVIDFEVEDQEIVIGDES